MAGRITELRYQKRNRDRVNVFVEGAFVLGLPDVDAARLKVGQFLSDEDIAALRDTDVEQKAYDRALRFLGYRPRSEAEVKRNLLSAGVDEWVIERVMERLRSQGYLNDVEFARYWIENRERFRPRGARALQQELRNKGVSKADSAELLSEIDAEGSAYRAAQAKARQLAPLLASDRMAFRRKLGDFLGRRGFDYEVTRAVVARLEAEFASSADDGLEED